MIVRNYSRYLPCRLQCRHYSPAAGQSWLHPTASESYNLCFPNFSSSQGAPVCLGFNFICLYFLWLMISKEAVISIPYLEGSIFQHSIYHEIKRFLLSVFCLKKINNFSFWSQIYLSQPKGVSIFLAAAFFYDTDFLWHKLELGLEHSTHQKSLYNANFLL